jgi:hypothetical protein
MGMAVGTSCRGSLVHEPNCCAVGEGGSDRRAALKASSISKQAFQLRTALAQATIAKAFRSGRDADPKLRSYRRRWRG